MGGWQWERMKSEGFGSSIFEYLYILKSRVQSTCVASMVFREVTDLEENLLRELK